MEEDILAECNAHPDREEDSGASDQQGDRQLQGRGQVWGQVQVYRGRRGVLQRRGGEIQFNTGCLWSGCMVATLDFCVI